MATTQIADVIVPEVFNPYVVQRTAELSALRRSGIAQGSPELNRLASAGGKLINMPFWNDLSGADEVLSDAAALTPAKITAGQDIAVLLMRGKAWSVNDLATALSGDDPMGTDRGVGKIWPNTQWLGNLSGALARYYGCRIILSQMTKNKKHISVSGRESARVTFQLMLPFVVKQVRQRAKVLMAEEGYSKLVAERRMANALTFRLQKLVTEMERGDAERVTQGNGTALVPVDEIEAEMKLAFPDLTPGRASRISTSSAARKQAEQISLYRQTGGTQQRRIG